VVNRENKMSAEQNKSIVTRWVEGGWNQGNLGLVDQLYAPNYTLHDPTVPMPIENGEAFKQFVGWYRTVFPDLHFTIEHIVAEGDLVAWRFAATGTHEGAFQNIPPTGKAVHISWHGAGHLIAASIGFTALIVACFVMARYFSRARHRGLAVFSRVTGLAFLAAFAGVTTGSSASAVVVPFYAAVLLAWIWIAVTSAHLYRRTDPATDAGGR